MAPRDRMIHLIPPFLLREALGFTPPIIWEPPSQLLAALGLLNLRCYGTLEVTTTTPSRTAPSISSNPEPLSQIANKP
jgi:hypothetical protein